MKPLFVALSALAATVIAIAGATGAAAMTAGSGSMLRVADIGAPPPPAVNPLRGFRRSSASMRPADVAPTALAPTAEAVAIDLPPLPDQNPLRAGHRSRGLAGATPISAGMPPVRSADATPSTTGVHSPVYALAPLLNHDISDQDIELLRRSIDHVLRDHQAEAAATRDQIQDPVARKLALWYQLRKNENHPSPLELDRFGNENTDWPSGSLMRRVGEQAMFKTRADARTVTAFYAKSAPTTGLGRLLLARALKQSGRTAEATALAREAWRSETFGPQSEGELLDEFGAVLTLADHAQRADHFLYKDNQQLLPSIERVLRFLPPSEQKRAKLRASVTRKHLAAAEKEFARLGDAALDHPGLLLSRIQLARRAKDFETAWRLFARAPLDAKKMGSPRAWWLERQLEARLALQKGKPSVAYQIVSRHGDISGSALVEAEFLAGWIALTRLNDPARAEKHFAVMEKHAEEDQDQAKAAYWLGRSRLAHKDQIGALSHFSRASKFRFHFYGQLALQRLDSSGLSVQERPEPPTDADIRRFLARDAVRALIIAHKARLEGMTPLFFSQLSWRLQSAGEMTLLAELAAQIRSQHGSVLTGKVGIHRGFALDRYAYPINALPAYDRLTTEVDKSLLLALARQESEFNPDARSPVGARGMMQIMPGTAKMIARDHGVSYDRNRLASDPAYNVALGVAHVHDLIKQYNGSYVLTLVAYNAGPGRARQWIEAFGDPRSRDVDAVDWVEAIPFDETRRYVQRILASAQVFRHRLRGGKGQIRLVQDLERGTPDADTRKASVDDDVVNTAASSQ